MPLLTAKALKARERPEFYIDLGGGDEVLVRRPDLYTLVFSGVLPLLLVQSVMEMVSKWQGATPDQITGEILKNNKEMSTFVNLWICEAMILPHCVLTESARTSDDDIVINDLNFNTRSTIFSKSFSFTQPSRSEVAAATTFPEDGPREGIGSDVPAIQPETVVGVGTD